MIKRELLVLIFGMMAFQLNAQVSDFKMFPNPFINKVEFQFNSTSLPDIEYTIEVINLIGQTISSNTDMYHFGTNKFEINTSSLKNGLYLFRFRSVVDTLVVKGIKNGIVGVESPIITNPIQIYPNPTNRFLYINFNTDFKSQFIQFYDFLGREVIKTQVEGIKKYELDLLDLNTGMYLIVVRDLNGIVLTTKMISKN